MNIFRAIGILYLASGIWCLFKPDLAMGFLSLSALSPIGTAEFVSVYGGLQIGMGLAMVSASFLGQPVVTGVLFCIWIQSCLLVVCRVYALLAYESNQALLGMLILEVTIALLLFWIMTRLGVIRQLRSA